MSTDKPRPRMGVNAVSLALTLALMRDDPCTVTDLVEETGIHRITMLKWIRVFHHYELIHVCGWVEDRRGRRVMRQYRLGQRRDSPKPPRLTPMERTRAYRERMKRNEAVRALAAAAGELAHGGTREEDPALEHRDVCTPGTEDPGHGHPVPGVDTRGAPPGTTGRTGASPTTEGVHR